MDVAGENGGYVTPSLVDVPAVELRKMVARGTLHSVCRCVYRVPSLPFDRNDEFILARFWAAGRGTISHDSALLIHELCDINPAPLFTSRFRRVIGSAEPAANAMRSTGPTSPRPK